MKRAGKATRAPNAIRDLRTSRGLSLQQLADAVGLSKAHVWEIEKGHANLGGMAYDTACCLAAALGTSVTLLMASRGATPPRVGARGKEK